jgi:hypothetical protein
MPYGTLWEVSFIARINRSKELDVGRKVSSTNHFVIWVLLVCPTNVMKTLSDNKKQSPIGDCFFVEY